VACKESVMSKPIAWSEDAAREAIEENVDLMRLEVGQALDLPRRVGERFSWVASPVWPNMCFRLRLPAEEREACLRELRGEQSTGGAPPVVTVFRHRGYHEALEAAGLKRAYSFCGMAADLGTAPVEVLLPDGVELIEGSAVPATEWCGVVSAALTGGLAFDPRIPAALLERGSGYPFMACVAGRPVATSMLYLAGGVAGVYLVATLTGWRSRGIGTAMTEAVLARARQLGYKTAVLYATDIGRPIYARMGFQELSFHDYYKPAE
jgi:ribosomal protein S18 acetylase RimI-like enzyme